MSMSLICNVSRPQHIPIFPPSGVYIQKKLCGFALKIFRYWKLKGHTS